ncbi:hypothetical protein FPHYL_12086 [Fusarium phyllophilum]|uniref:Uncharacterized protein n=1 Tax=Fusarium phyllophilum TaxID=47803 RepID=A0A8H5INA8_9HYPO|nr:hypothetical protein FPHYL_12086 [Fusarium phyllophilum]
MLASVIFFMKEVCFRTVNLSCIDFDYTGTMKPYYALCAVAPLLCNATELEAPIEGYGVVVPEWEVEITPGGPATVLNGTIEEVHEELLQLNPDWDEEYTGNSTESELTERDPSFQLFARTDFSDSEYHCGGRWLKCRTTIINQGISYLRRTKGKPKNGPGPGNCGRVSCSFNSAIWWCNDVLAIDAPIEGYGVVIPEWEVEVTSGSTTVLGGTIEEIHEELLQLNPNWDEEYMPNSTQAAADAEKRDLNKHLFGRTNFNGAKCTCRGRWPECHPAPIVRGIEYLRYIQGKPKNRPGPGNCGRNASSKTLNGFGSIADGAEYINDKCTRWGWQNGGYRSFVSGQVFHKTNWNVIVRKDKC